MKSIKRKGFTLVELLIVIVVIGILSAMMMLSSTEAVSSAKANNIISNLRNLKTAVLSWYADNINRVVVNNKNCQIKLDDNSTQYLTAYVNANPGEFTKYLSSENITVKAAKGSTLAVGDYIIDGKDEGQLWVVGCYIGNDTK